VLGGRAAVEAPARGAARYGWVVVAVTFATNFVFTGLYVYTYGIALRDLAAEFDAGRSAVSGVHFVAPWTSAALAPLVGRWAAQGWLRHLITAGVLAAGGGFYLASRATALWHLYAVFPTLLAFSGVTLIGVCASAIVVNWFERDRAMALGISQMGVSVGGVVMGQAAAALVGSHGWRGTFELYAVWMLVLAPIVFVLARPSRTARGFGRDASAQPGAASHGATSWSVLVRDPRLWGIAYVTGIGFAVGGAMSTHLFALATDRGFQPEQAGVLISVWAAGAFAGKLLFGALSDRWGERRAYLACVAMTGLGTLAIIAAPANAIYGVVAGLGLGVGGVLPVSAAFVARLFGADGFGPAMGLVTALMTPLIASAIPLTGYAFDRTGSYTPAFVAFAAGLLVAGAVLTRMRPEEAESAAAAA
jgi:MFS family permease